MNPAPNSTLKTPRVSVLMSLYNRAPYVGMAIESILKQDFKDYELLICDDCSTDDSLAIAERYAVQDDRIRIIRNDRNRNVPYTMNRLLNDAHGELCAVMDADDISLPTRLSAQLELIDRDSEVNVVGTLAQSIDFAGKRVHQPAGTVGDDRCLKEGFLARIPFSFGTMLFTTAIPRKHGIVFNESIVAAFDTKFMVQVLPFARLAVVPEVLYLFRLHHAQHTRSALVVNQACYGRADSTVAMLRNCGVTSVQPEALAALFGGYFGYDDGLRKTDLRVVRQAVVEIFAIKRICEYEYKQAPTHIVYDFLRLYLRFLWAKYSHNPAWMVVVFGREMAFMVVRQPLPLASYTARVFGNAPKRLLKWLAVGLGFLKPEKPPVLK